MSVQIDLFAPPPALPEGLRHADGVLSPDVADAVVARLGDLPFQAFDFHGFKGLRRIVSFGARYDFSAARLREAEPLPDFLAPVRDAAAAFAGVDPAAFAHVLITEYAPGAGIGWHRDRPEFDKIVGVSFGAPAVLRFRRREGERWRRASLKLDPRSAYLLDGAARTDWQHSIAPGEALRYSATFRTLRA